VDLISQLIRLIQGKTKRAVEIPMNNTVQTLIKSRWHNGNDFLSSSPKNRQQGIPVKKAMLGASLRAKIEPITIRDLKRTFGTRLCELNVNTTVTVRLPEHGDLRSVHRYERGKEIMREAGGL
jgi:integrase